MGEQSNARRFRSHNNTTYVHASTPSNFPCGDYYRTSCFKLWILLQSIGHASTVCSFWKSKSCQFWHFNSTLGFCTDYDYLGHLHYTNYVNPFTWHFLSIRLLITTIMRPNLPIDKEYELNFDVQRQEKIALLINILYCTDSHGPAVYIENDYLFIRFMSRMYRRCSGEICPPE